MSVAVANPVAEGVVGLLQVNCTLGGHMMVGGTSSMVCTVVVQVLVLLHQSVTVNVTVVFPQPVSTVGLMLMDWMPQLSVEPPSIWLVFRV
jgi:hypothetical protein